MALAGSMTMSIYNSEISFGGGWCDGTHKIRENSEREIERRIKYTTHE